MMLDEGEFIQSLSNDHAIGLISNNDIIVMRYNQLKHKYKKYGAPVALCGYPDFEISFVPALSQYCREYSLEFEYQCGYRELTVVVSSDDKDEVMFHARNIPWWRQMSCIFMNGTEYFVATTQLT